MKIGLRLLVWAALSAIGGAQVPARDSTAAPLPPRVGSAMVSGLVVSEGSPARPLRRATVSLVSPDLGVPLATVTDDAGRFLLTSVPSGNYTIAASKPAFVGAFFGSLRPGRGPGVPVAVRDGQRISNITLTLRRGGVIAGTLKLPSGEPAAGMSVTVVAIEGNGGARHLGFAGGRASTDDRGQYRVYGLPPGAYLVQAEPAGLLSGALSGANDARQTTASEVRWAIGSSPSASAGGPPAPDRGRTMNYAAVYFPGTPDPSAAELVVVTGGDERNGVDFALALVPTARVSGVVLDADGRTLPNVSVTLATRDDTLGMGSLVTPRAAVKSGADGSFSVPAVAPGHYVLSARTSVAPGLASTAHPIIFWAASDVDVDGQAVADLALSLQPGMTVSGRVVLESSGTDMPSGDLKSVRMTLTPALSGSVALDAIRSATSTATPAGTIAGIGAPPLGVVTAVVAADGTFTATGLTPGTYRVAFSVPGGVWWLRSVVHGVDAADQTIEIRPHENLDGVVATFTNRPTDLSGTLTDQANRPAPGYPIVVFSTDRRDWTPGSRRVAEVRPSTDGTFRLVGLPAGSYYLCAVVDLDRGDLDDPSFLDQLVRAASTITLTEGHATVQNFTLAGGATSVPPTARGGDLVRAFHPR